MKFCQYFALVAEASAIGFDTWPNGPTFNITYDETRMRMKLSSTVPENQWLGIGFGEGM